MDKLIEEVVKNDQHLRHLISICEGNAKMKMFIFACFIEYIYSTSLLNYNALPIHVLVAQRQVGETSLNDKSSRSHQIIRLVCFNRSLNTI